MEKKPRHLSKNLKFRFFLQRCPAFPSHVSEKNLRNDKIKKSHFLIFLLVGRKNVAFFAVVVLYSKREEGNNKSKKKKIQDRWVGVRIFESFPTTWGFSIVLLINNLLSINKVVEFFFTRVRSFLNFPQQINQRTTGLHKLRDRAPFREGKIWAPCFPQRWDVTENWQGSKKKKTKNKRLLST